MVVAMFKVCPIRSNNTYLCFGERSYSSGQKMSKLQFPLPKITVWNFYYGRWALTTGHPPFEKAPASGLPAISANFRAIIKAELGSSGRRGGGGSVNWKARSELNLHEELMEWGQKWMAFCRSSQSFSLIFSGFIRQWPTREVNICLETDEFSDWIQNNDHRECWSVQEGSGP